MVPAALLLAAQRDRDGQYVAAVAEPLHDWATASPYGTAIVLVLWAVGLSAVGPGIARLADRGTTVGDKSVLKLFKVLEEIVGPKAERFMEFHRRVRISAPAPDPSDVFREITQPEQQIALAIRGVHTFFDAFDTKDVDFACAIVLTGSDHQQWVWYAHWPPSEPPLAPASTGSHTDHPVRRAFETRKIVIVEDWASEQRRLRSRPVANAPVTGADEPEDASMLCYPVVYGSGQDVPFVIVVTARRRKYFRKEQKELYKWILSHFEVRIRLEHALLAIRRISLGDDEA